MAINSVYSFIRQLGRPVFTTDEVRAISGRSPSAATQALNYLARQGLIFKVYRGVWAETGAGRVSPYSVMPFLFSRQRVYLSFISALHLHGIIEQIPQVITVASASHTKTLRTKAGTFSVHQLAPSFFKGFEWYKGAGSFLIAEPEKALVDSLYLSACKKRQFGHFPELHFPGSFSFKKAEEWAKTIPNAMVRTSVQKKLAHLKDANRSG
jgi:predicted transcriptional regulator of viral defense system